MTEYEWKLWRYLMAEKIIRMGDFLRMARPTDHELLGTQVEYHRLCNIWDRGMVVRV